jgi:hypothetical protein
MLSSTPYQAASMAHYLRYECIPEILEPARNKPGGNISFSCSGSCLTLPSQCDMSGVRECLFAYPIHQQPKAFICCWAHLQPPARLHQHIPTAQASLHGASACTSPPFGIEMAHIPLFKIWAPALKQDCWTCGHVHLEGP